MCGPVVPDAAERYSVSEGTNRMDAGPELGACHETFLGSLGEAVREPPMLHLGLVADQDRVVPAAPERPIPVVEVSGLLGEVSLDEVHEAGKVPCVLRAQEGVPVVRHAGHGMDLDIVAAPRSGENSDETAVQLRAWTEKVPGLEGSGAHLDQGTGRDETFATGHIDQDANRTPNLTGGHGGRQPAEKRVAPCGKPSWTTPAQLAIPRRRICPSPRLGIEPGYRPMMPRSPAPEAFAFGAGESCGPGASDPARSAPLLAPSAGLLAAVRGRFRELVEP